ncbi:MAG: fasciclin [Saprospirales bacterium]|nr:fasciclin [Saprospirales bacterium]
MKNLTNVLGVTLLVLFGIFTTACSDDDNQVQQPQTISQIAAGDAQFSTLVGALDRVGLVSVLDGAGTFTVFAPTNAAFDALGVDLNTLTDDQLKDILLYHVLGAQVMSTDLSEGQTYASTASTSGPNGTALSVLIEKSSSGVKVNNVANVTTADIEASNGVIHVIDNVILPLDIVGHAAANSNFTELVGALGAASGDLVTVLSGDGPFTVFAPLNSAFEAISDVTATLTADQLAKVLTYHVVAGNVLSSQLSNGMTVATVNGESFTININGSAVTITDANGNVANVVLTDVQATNGVIHVLDKVILPESL